MQSSRPCATRYDDHTICYTGEGKDTQVEMYRKCTRNDLHIPTVVVLRLTPNGHMERSRPNKDPKKSCGRDNDY